MNTKKIIFSILFLFLSFYGVTSAVDTGYVTLEPGFWNGLGGTSNNATSSYTVNTANLGDFLSKIFNFGIAIAVALSVVVISIGGIQYMTTDSWNKKEEGKERIRNALMGLGLALISWLILFTINPCLVTFSGTTLNNTQCSNTVIGTTK